MGTMPVALQGPLAGTDSETIHRKRWTRDECDFLVQSELIDPKRYELIEGELIEKVSKTHAHIQAVLFVVEWLRRFFPPRTVIQEPSILLAQQDTPSSDPEPDVIVLNRPYNALPGKASPGDIVLVVEVAYTSLALDTTRKAALYARAGIPDYWVLDIRGRRLIVHREPAAGLYGSITEFSEAEPVAPLAAPSAEVRAQELL